MGLDVRSARGLQGAALGRKEPYMIEGWSVHELHAIAREAARLKREACERFRPAGRRYGRQPLRYALATHDVRFVLLAAEKVRAERGKRS